MHLRKSKKVLLYFFLLIVVSSINNLELNDFKLYKIENIKISGFNDNENEDIIKNIKSLDLQNIFFLNSKEIKKIINANTLIEKYNIIKKYPSTLSIEIEKTNFLAKIKSKNQIFLLGSNGKLSNTNFSSDQLPFIFGNPSIDEFLRFKKVIDESKFSYNQIKNFYFFPSKRWDLKFENNILLKLPNKNTKISLDNLFNFINDKNLTNIKIVDARVKNQIILND